MTTSTRKKSNGDVAIQIIVLAGYDVSSNSANLGWEAFPVISIINWPEPFHYSTTFM
jgi:hypothetical protein